MLQSMDERKQAKFLSNDQSYIVFENCHKLIKDSKQIVNWLKGEMLSRLSDAEITIKDSPISPIQLCD